MCAIEFTLKVRNLKSVALCTSRKGEMARFCDFRRVLLLVMQWNAFFGPNINFLLHILQCNIPKSSITVQERGNA